MITILKKTYRRAPTSFYSFQIKSILDLKIKMHTVGRLTKRKYERPLMVCHAHFVDFKLYLFYFASTVVQKVDPFSLNAGLTLRPRF